MTLSEHSAHPHSVFLVEDHPLIRRVLTKFLNAEPSLVVVGEARSGEEALITLDRLEPEIILVDFSLPGMNGAELIERLRATTHPHARYLVISSHDARRYVDLSLTAGAHGFVSKGNPDVLVRAISRVLDGHTVVELGH